MHSYQASQLANLFATLATALSSLLGLGLLLRSPRS
jgi:hypothetical protein